jgi:hypothetical protein
MPPSEKPSTSSFGNSSARQKSTQLFVIAATVDGVSPVEPATPALSNKITSRSAAKPFVTLGSQSSMFGRQATRLTELATLPLANTPRRLVSGGRRAPASSLVSTKPLESTATPHPASQPLSVMPLGFWLGPADCRPPSRLVSVQMVAASADAGKTLFLGDELLQQRRRS